MVNFGTAPESAIRCRRKARGIPLAVERHHGPNEGLLPLTRGPSR